LNKSSAEAFNNKVSLIYEFDKTSPLFIRKAEVEIENNHIERAIEILNAGLKLYPDYIAAHLLLGKAWALTGHFDAALEINKSGMCQSAFKPYLRILPKRNRDCEETKVVILISQKGHHSLTI